MYNYVCISKYNLQIINYIYCIIIVLSRASLGSHNILHVLRAILQGYFVLRFDY